MPEKVNVNKKIFTGLLFFLFLISSVFFKCINAYADESYYSYLYFYTIDGEEIEDLTKKIKAGKEYEFEDPDLYKYLPYEDEDGNIIYNELNDQVTGLYWEEELDGSDLGQYKAGDVASFSSGDHFFRVKSDNPALTGENLIDTPSSEHAYLYFYSSDFDPIDELEKELYEDDEFTFPDPNDYVHIEDGDNNGESGLDGNGIYWACTDENEKKYLFKKGDKCKFKPGDYEFHVVTDDPVTVTFHYPLDITTYISTDNNPGETYDVEEVKVGDKINLKKSLGAIVWGATFKGWNEMNFEDSDELFKGGASYQIMDNVDLDFFAVYEEDDDWDPFAKDENGKTHEEDEEEIIVDVGKVNEAAGVGFGAYVDSSGNLQRAGNGNQINNNVKINGIPGLIKEEGWLSGMKDKKGDPNDPENYDLDNYGRDIEDSNLPIEINNVLRQNDSAYYMDVYGNSFIYYSNMSRENNISLAYERLKLGKTDSWARNTEDLDSETIKRFEAIEFALIKGKYPAEGEDLLASVDPSIKGSDTLIWKNSYMSEKAFKRLLPYKKMWHGWYDKYNDGLYEKYKNNSGGNIEVVGKSTEQGTGLFSLFGGITAYAEDNSVGTVNRLDSRKLLSLDIDALFSPQYYDPSKIYSFSSYGFAGLSELSPERIQTLQTLFSSLVDYGFSEEMAAGACGNIWQESGGFNYKAYNSSGYYGLVQWGQSRAIALKKYAAEHGSTWDDLNIQIGFLEYELTTSFLNDINKYLSKWGMNASNVDNVTLACDAFCYAVERCTCVNGGKLHTAHNSECAPISGMSASYQHLLTRRKNAEKIYGAMTVMGGMIGGDFANMSNSDILTSIFGYSTMRDIGAAYTGNQIESRFMTTIRLNSGKSLYCNKFVADDLKQALDQIESTGFPLLSVYCYARRANTSNSAELSFHAVGLAIDINPSSNPQFYKSQKSDAWIKANYRPGIDPQAVTVNVYNILKSHGFLWGRDFRSRPDLMHFSVGEVGTDGYNAYISQITEGVS